MAYRNKQRAAIPMPNGESPWSRSYRGKLGPAPMDVEPRVESEPGDATADYLAMERFSIETINS